MAKARLGTITERWIDGKTGRRIDVKTEKPKTVAEKTKLTIYVSKDVVKTLWYNRAETGEPISHTVEQLVVRHLRKK